MARHYTDVSLPRNVGEKLRMMRHVGETYGAVIERLMAATSTSHIISRRKDNWEELLNILEKTEDKPLEIIGTPAAGKTWTIRELTKHDKEHIYFVIDSHGEYPDLPTVPTFSLGITESCRYLPPSEFTAFAAMAVDFEVRKKLLDNKGLIPKNFVLVVEEAARFKGLEFFGLESRKFIKTLLVTPNKLYGDGDLIDCVRVIPDIIQARKPRKVAILK